MGDRIETPYLLFKKRAIQPIYSEQLGYDDKMAQDVAGKLFEAGIRLACIAERRPYDSGPITPAYHDLRLILQGGMRVEMDGRTYVLKPGDMVVCPAGTTMHCISEKGGVRSLYFQIRDLPEWEPFKRRGGYVRACESAHQFFLLLRETLDAMASHDPAAMARGLSNSQALVDRLHIEMRRSGKESSKHAAAVQELVRAVTAKPGMNWSRSTLADKLNVSVSLLKQIFRKEIGISPLELVVRQRMKRALHELVNTDHKIELIAAELGYASLHSFTRLFTKHIGMSPGRYRTRYRDSRSSSAPE